MSPALSSALPATLERPLAGASFARIAAALPWLAIVAVAALTTQCLWAPGALAGHSAWYDLTRMIVFDAAIRAGDWLPAWSADFYHGHGSPLFQFYAPLAYYLAEIPVLAGADYITALKLTQALTFAASGFAMFAFARRHVTPAAACFAAVLYMVAPYRFLDLYVRHSLAEHCAFVWLPLIALGTQRAVAGGGFLTGALATAALIFTHNVMAMIALPICIAVGWVLGARTSGTGPLLRAAAPAACGVALTTFFWWPSLASPALTHGPESLTAGHFDVEKNFASLGALLDPAWGFGESISDTSERMSVQIGGAHIAAGAGALLLLASRRRGKDVRWLLAGVATAVLAAILCHAISRPVWAALPLLAYVQFPWRFLGIVVFGAAMCGAALVDRSGKWAAGITAAASLAVLAVYFPCWREAWFLAVDEKSGDLARVRAGLLEAGMTSGRLASVTPHLTRTMVRETGAHATSLDDFLPRGVRRKPTAPPVEPVAAAGGRVLDLAQPAPNHYRARVSLREPGAVVLHQFWFPGWIASVNGRAVDTSAHGDTALVSCAAPAGESVVEFRYTHLPQRKAGGIVSLAALASLGVVALRKRNAA